MTSLTVHPELELELECSTEGRFLEPVGLDSQEEFQAANEVKCLPPADETLSVKEGDTRYPGEEPSAHPDLNPKT